jgi:hypothetical protein
MAEETRTVFRVRPFQWAAQVTNICDLGGPSAAPSDAGRASTSSATTESGQLPPAILEAFRANHESFRDDFEARAPWS